MNIEKIGSLIFTLRTEKGMTQKQLADVLAISDKTVSKWERGAGCPDISLLRTLCDYFGVDMEKMLDGELAENDFTGGNMKKSKFYVSSGVRQCNGGHRRCIHPLLRQEAGSTGTGQTGKKAGGEPIVRAGSRERERCGQISFAVPE